MKGFHTLDQEYQQKWKSKAMTHPLSNIIGELNKMLKNNGEVKTTYLANMDKPNFHLLESLGVIRVRHDLGDEVRKLVSDTSGMGPKARLVIGGDQGRKDIRTTPIGYFLAAILMDQHIDRSNYHNRGL